jgi:nucleotide-binding universal stress UspA family protein
MKTRILFPVDFSSGATQALQLAVSLARDQQGELVLLHVEELPLAYGGGEFYYGLAEPNRAQLVKMLGEVVVSDPKLAVQRHVVAGSPASAIVSFAEQYDIDYIVMPTHGRTGLKRLLMGSVAEEVVRKAPCPVVTVKCTATQVPAAPKAKELSHVGT